MQYNNNQYYFLKTITYDLTSESSAITIEKKDIELISIDRCCFNKLYAKKGPAAIFLDVSKVIIKRSSFVKMASHSTTNPGASSYILSSNTAFNYSSAIKCESNVYDNFYFSGKKQILSYLNNTHNQIKHITFAYLTDCTNTETSYCNVCHNPSEDGVEFQTCRCTLSVIHHCSFTNNKCKNKEHNKFGVVRLYLSGTLNANMLYFYNNDKLPLSEDNNNLDGKPILNAENVYTDNNKFYSVNPEHTYSVDVIPVFFCEHAAAKCMKETNCNEPRLKYWFIAAATFWLSKLLQL